MGRLDGKIAIITGAARGQGAAEAELFVGEGASVVVADVLTEEGQALADRLGSAAAFAPLDVRESESWHSVVDLASRQFGGVDVLVNNAGIIRYGALTEMPVAVYRDVVEVNQFGTFLGMQAVAPAMVKRGGGSIVNISSIDGISPMAGTIAYAASKFAIRGMTRVAALELGPLGIRVNSVHPGGVATPMTSPETIGVDVTPYFSRLPLGRIGQPMDVASVVAFLASDDSGYCTGAELVVDGGWIAGHSLV
jgi:3alpha(or 20beta)-hydroxysteroid dehydrogenase